MNTKAIIIASCFAILTACSGMKSGSSSEGNNNSNRVDKALNKMDTDGDGKISKGEAKFPLSSRFDDFDTNADGFLDRDELDAIKR